MAVPGRKAEQHQSSGSAPDYEHSCDACLVDGQDVEAHGYCFDCQDYLCVTCFRFHRKNRASRNHRLVDNTASLPANVTKPSTETCTVIEKCAEHEGQLLKFFCPKHEALACHDCVTLDHRTCDIDYIPKTCVGVTRSKEYIDTFKKLNDLLDDVNCVQKMANRKSCEVENAHKKAVKEIDKFQKDLNDLIYQLRCQIVGEVASEKEKQNDGIGTVLKICERLASDIKQVKTSSQENEAAQREGQIYISMKRAEQIIKSREIEKAKADLHAIPSEITFKRNRAIENTLSDQMTFGTLIRPEPHKKSEPVSLVAETYIKQHRIRYPKVRKYFQCSSWEACKKRIEENTPCVTEISSLSEKDEDSCEITIYAENKTKAGNAVRSIEHTVKEEWIMEGLEDERIRTLRFNRIKEIKAMARNNYVDVTIDTDVGSIEVTGLVANVHKVLEAVHNTLRSADKSSNTKYAEGSSPITGFSLDMPMHWETMTSNEYFKVVILKPSDSEYKKVLSEFTESLGKRPNIIKIERVQNRNLYLQYLAKRQYMNANSPTRKDNEKVLWYGTTDNAVQSINSHGFNRGYSGKRETAFGHGLYFAVNASYSNQAAYTPPGSDGDKRVYRCMVLTGRYCNGSSNMRVPPAIDKSRPHELYDSVTDNNSNPKLFVIFNDTQAYPEHLITYR